MVGQLALDISGGLLVAEADLIEHVIGLLRAAGGEAGEAQIVQDAGVRHVAEGGHVDRAGFQAVQDVGVAEQGAAPEDGHGDGTVGVLVQQVDPLVNDHAAGLSLLIGGGERNLQGLYVDGFEVGHRHRGQGESHGENHQHCDKLLHVVSS